MKQNRFTAMINRVMVCLIFPVVLPYVLVSAWKQCKARYGLSPIEMDQYDPGWLDSREFEQMCVTAFFRFFGYKG